MVQNKKDILVIGHKGSGDIVPENTLKAFKKAIELRADYIEFDTHKTKDNEIVIIHDADTIRTSGTPGVIKDMTLLELKELDVGQGEKIPTLKELIEIARGKIGLQIEIKAEGIVEDLPKILKKNELHMSSIISSFSFEELLKLKKIEPTLKLGYLLPEPIQRPKLIKRLTQKAIDNNFYAIHPHFNAVNKDFVQFAHENNLKINVWTVNDKDIMKNLIELGVDGIITDFISLARKLLGRIN